MILITPNAGPAHAPPWTVSPAGIGDLMIVVKSPALRGRNLLELGRNLQPWLDKAGVTLMMASAIAAAKVKLARLRPSVNRLKITNHDD